MLTVNTARPELWLGPAAPGEAGHVVLIHVAVLLVVEIIPGTHVGHTVSEVDWLSLIITNIVILIIKPGASHLPDKQHVGLWGRLGRVEALHPDTRVQAVQGGPGCVPGAGHHPLVIMLRTLLVQEPPRQPTLVAEIIAVGF